MFGSTFSTAIGLLGLASAQNCLFKVSIDLIRFDDITAETILPNGYHGLNWTGFTATYTPVANTVGGQEPFLRASPEGAVVVDSGAVITFPGPKSKRFGIKSFDAACVFQDGREFRNATYCPFTVQGLGANGGRPRTNHNEYTYEPSSYYAQLSTYSPTPDYDVKSYVFTITGGEKNGKTPSFIMDNLIIWHDCD